MHFGIVKNNVDPLQLGRVKVNVFGMHNEIDTIDLPWSQVMMPGNTPAISGQGHSVNLQQEILWKKGELLPKPITTGAPEFKVITEVDDDTTPATGDVKIVGSLVVGIFLDSKLQEFMVMGSLPTKTNDTPWEPKDPVEDNNIRVRAGADPNTEDPVGLYQPPSTYAPVYPYNNVYETGSGHVKEYDDTPGVERITERHKSGTRYEIDPNGTKNETIVRDNYQLVAGHDTLEVYGNVKIVVGGDVDIAVAGDVTAKVTGDISLVGVDADGDKELGITMDNTNDKIILETINNIVTMDNTNKKITLQTDDVEITGNLKVVGTTHTSTSLKLDDHKHNETHDPITSTDVPHN
tara:strand:+ start:5048 stop:6097 length:1050 start_codon:yes stop_codon:yes gene_type:complete